MAVVVERTRTVAVRLTPDEHAAWLAAASAAGRGRLGSWARDQIAASLAVSPAVSPAVQAAPVGVAVVSEVGGGVLPAAQVRAQLARVGNLLNQAVRLGNFGGVDAETAERLVLAVGATRQVVAALNAQLRARP